MPITPYLQTPFTDLTGSLINHQSYDKCGTMEMNMMECLEAYGAERGKKMCKDLIDDYNECFTMHKQMLRFHVRNQLLLFRCYKIPKSIKNLSFRPCAVNDIDSIGLANARKKNYTHLHQELMLTR